MEREAMNAKDTPQVRLALAAIVLVFLSGCAELNRYFPLEEVKPKQEQR